MRTPRELYHGTPIVYSCELDICLECGEPLKVAYVSAVKTVQTLTGVLGIAHRPMYCPEPSCGQHKTVYKSAQWQQIAPLYCTYGYDVIAHIGWQRQTGRQSFQALREGLQARVQISEAEVRHLYQERYLPLLACHERLRLDELTAMAERVGLILSLDGLAPEGGEPQLWVVRELQTRLTLRSGWLSQQDQGTFERFLQPIHDLGLPVAAIISDKQRGLVPAVAVVFPQAKHSFCQMHYLKNAAEPVAASDQDMKITLRQSVRAEIGSLIRQEQVETEGVLTVTGLVPSPVETEMRCQAEDPIPHNADALIGPERETVVQDLKRRIRYLLTLKGRPPFRLAGIEMFERLTEVKDCLTTLITHYPEPQLVPLHQGLHAALQAVQAEYTALRQAADWLQAITHILDPDDKPARSGTEVRQELFAYLDTIPKEGPLPPDLDRFYQAILKTSHNYAPGLFHCYDLPGLPRTNNDRESEFRDLNRRLLQTSGQKGLVRRTIQRQGAWELIPRPDSLHSTVLALSQVNTDDFRQERHRVRVHRDRFRLHTRSAKQSRRQLEQLTQRWLALPAQDST
jgi:hypothetical protein